MNDLKNRISGAIRARHDWLIANPARHINDHDEDVCSPADLARVAVAEIHGDMVEQLKIMVGAMEQSVPSGGFIKLSVAQARELLTEIGVTPPTA